MDACALKDHQFDYDIVGKLVVCPVNSYLVVG